LEQAHHAHFDKVTESFIGVTSAPNAAVAARIELQRVIDGIFVKTTPVPDDHS
jgi:hypothetical protein